VSDETPEFGGFGVGSRLAGYRLDEQIGRGGMAVVYRAYDIRLERPVAIKVLSPELARDEAFRQRFIRESRTAAAVDHPNIIPIFEAGEANGVLFIAMRFVHGPNVQELVNTEGPLSAARACHIITQVAAGLEAAHSHGLVHRDVKPGNMLLDMAGGGDYPGHAYLSDFGLSKRALSVSALTSTGQFLGTLDYVAPEQIEARAVTGRADEYALACSAFTMLTGHPPFVRDESVAVMWAQISAPPPALTSRRPDLPAAVDEVMAKAMAKVPADRYGTCPEFAAALRRACGLESGPGLVPEPAADFPDVPLRESTQVVPVVPADPGGPGGTSPGSPPDPGSWTGQQGTGQLGTGQPGAVPAGATAAADPGPAATDPGPALADAGAAPGESGPATELPGAARGESGPATELSGAARGESGPATELSGAARGESGPATELPGPARAAPEAESASPGFPEAEWYRPRSAEAGPPTAPPPLPPDATRDVPAVAPGGYSPGPPGRPPAFSRQPAASRPEPPRRRRGLWAAVALAVVVVLAAVGYLARNSFSTGAKTTGSAQAETLKPPGCTTATAKGTQLKHVGSHLVQTGGHPFDVVTVPGFAFVSGAGTGLAVMNTSKPVPSVMWSSALQHAQGEALTPDGRYLLVTGGTGITVFQVSSLEQAAGAGSVGSLGIPGQKHAEDVAVTPDGKFAFVTYQDSAHVGVFDLQRALKSGFQSPGVVAGTIPVGPQPIGIAMAPDGKRAYVASGQDHATTSGAGVLNVIDVPQAEKQPGPAVVMKSVPAGCQTNRVAFSPDGQQLWVTAVGSNALLGFSAAKLVSDPAHALIARVAVGQSPLGLAVISNGSRIVVADSNRDGGAGAEANLAVVDTAKALAGKPALVGYLRSGLQPRQFAVVSHSTTLLVTNSKSAQVQTVDLSRLP
jgi:DNA-binding beta-propeller fold protein YncE/tRNA A-37 threonylcarbamoyl transferase component Bud32